MNIDYGMIFGVLLGLSVVVNLILIGSRKRNRKAMEAKLAGILYIDREDPDFDKRGGGVYLQLYGDPGDLREGKMVMLRVYEMKSDSHQKQGT